MSVIGKALNPRFFRLGHPHVPYLLRKTRQQTRKTLRKGSMRSSLPLICKTTSKPVVLLRDNCGPHSFDLVDICGQVNMFHCHQTVIRNTIRWPCRLFPHGKHNTVIFL